MLQIDNISESPRQRQSLVLDDGTQVILAIYFVPMQYGWYITRLIYKDFTLNGFRIINSPNMLHQFRNQIPFGLACFSAGNREPSLQQDFSSGASKLYILTAAEVEQYAEVLSGQVQS